MYAAALLLGFCLPQRATWRAVSPRHSACFALRRPLLPQPPPLAALARLLLLLLCLLYLAMLLSEGSGTAPRTSVRAAQAVAHQQQATVQTAVSESFFADGETERNAEEMRCSLTCSRNPSFERHCGLQPPTVVIARSRLMPSKISCAHASIRRLIFRKQRLPCMSKRIICNIQSTKLPRIRTA
jgi:hypothetical protein